MNETSQLLVSVRSAAEALAALEGGAALIDVKEPARGSLGRAEDHIIREVVRAVSRRRPVSAAMGEWCDEAGEIPDIDLTYIKWGLAGCGRNRSWRQEMANLLEKRQQPRCVLVAYADWECAKAPPLDDVFALAVEYPGSVMLLDTHCKDAVNSLGKKRPTLLDWLPIAWVEDLCRRARESQVKIALAGSLGIAEIHALLPAQPAWFAVRGAVCDEGDRRSGVQRDKVRQLADMLKPRHAS